MTVADVIEELRKLPGHAPVLISQATFNEASGGNLEFSDEVASVVTWEGSHVLIGSDAA